MPPSSASDLAAAVDGFLAHASVERGLSPNTIEAYARDLARFMRYLESRRVRNPAGVRREHIAGFAVELEAAGLGARSRARAMVATRRSSPWSWLSTNSTQRADERMAWPGPSGASDRAVGSPRGAASRSAA